MLHPSFVSGLIDGEGSFAVNIRKNSKSRLGWSVEPTFRIRLHLKDEKLLKLVQAFFGVGLMHKGLDYVNFNVASLKEISNIISHLDKYPLITQKQADYLLFREVIIMMLNKEHLTPEGLDKIVGLKASLNWGLSEELKEAFPNTVPTKRPVINSQQILDPHWVAGFTSGEGSFMIRVRKSSGSKTGSQVLLAFQITQHSRDEYLMRSLVEYMGCGKVYKDKETFHYRVETFLDNYEKIIPFFNKYSIIGVKALEFTDWCEVAEMIKVKDHSTTSRLSRIISIKSAMNKGRI